MHSIRPHAVPTRRISKVVRKVAAWVAGTSPAMTPVGRKEQKSCSEMASLVPTGHPWARPGHSRAWNGLGRQSDSRAIAREMTGVCPHLAGFGAFGGKKPLCFQWAEKSPLPDFPTYIRPK
jgi:hypothetical protein